MVPLIVMLAAWLVGRLMGFVGLLPQADSWTSALRIALATMFVFTAVSHFHPRTRPDLIRMVPESLPARPLAVTATGVLELLGAVGLLVWINVVARFAFFTAGWTATLRSVEAATPVPWNPAPVDPPWEPTAEQSEAPDAARDDDRSTSPPR